MWLISLQGRPEETTSTLILIRRGRIGQKLGESGQSCLESARLQVLLIYDFSSYCSEMLGVVPLRPVMVVVSDSTLVASLADSVPHSADGFVLCGPCQLHLVHGVFIAEQLPTTSAMDLAVRRTQAFPTHRISTSVVAGWSLPVRSRD